MKKSNLLFLALLLCCACKTAVPIYKDRSADFKLIGENGTFPLDETYELYARAVTAKDRLAPGEKRAHRTLEVLDQAQKVKATKGEQQNSPIIEIEYLFLSRKHHKVLYISTVADRTQKLYNADGLYNLEHPNVADFRAFLFGQISAFDHNQFTFYHKDHAHTDNWTISSSKSGSVLTLTKIEQKKFNNFEDIFLIDEAFAHPITFEKQKNCEVIFQERAGKDTTKLLVPESISGGNIQFAKDGNKYMILFVFPSHRITFPDRFLPYVPNRHPGD